jgi:predicted translation initiation factor SUI1
VAKKTLLLVAPTDCKYARFAESAFAAAFHRLGMAWSVRRAEGETEADRVIREMPASEALVEPWVNQWIAVMLGGGQPAPVPPPPPPPKRVVHTAKLSREVAGRRGKGVTVVSGLPFGEEQLQELATHLKNKCGTGGTAKDGRIEIQGDMRDRIQTELEKLGYNVKRSGG